MKGKKPNQDLIDFLKSDPFVRVGVRSRILEKVKCKERERLRSETTEKMEYENIEFGVEGNINLNFKVEELENGKYELVENQQRNLEQKYGNFLNRFELKFKTMGGGEIEKRSEEIKSKIRFKNDKLKVAREFENDKILTKRVGEMSGNFNERLPNI